MLRALPARLFRRPQSRHPGQLVADPAPLDHVSHIQPLQCQALPTLPSSCLLLDIAMCQYSSSEVWVATV